MDKLAWICSILKGCVNIFVARANRRKTHHFLLFVYYYWLFMVPLLHVCQLKWKFSELLAPLFDCLSCLYLPTESCFYLRSNSKKRMVLINFDFMFLLRIWRSHIAERLLSFHSELCKVSWREYDLIIIIYIYNILMKTVAQFAWIYCYCKDTCGAGELLSASSAVLDKVVELAIKGWLYFPC